MMPMTMRTTTTNDHALTHSLLLALTIERRATTTITTSNLECGDFTETHAHTLADLRTHTHCSFVGFWGENTGIKPYEFETTNALTTTTTKTNNDNSVDEVLNAFVFC